MLTYIQGNLFDTTDEIICHGCNARGVMGSGVAKIIRDTYPEAFIKYKIIHDLTGLYLGQNVIVKTSNKIIFNMITQENFGTDKVQVSYQAIDKCFRQLRLFMEEYGYTNASIPKIGAGLAGGDWDIISEIISNIFNDNLNITVYYI